MPVTFSMALGPPPGIGLPAGVTLQAIDGETMLSPTVMSNNYYGRQKLVPQDVFSYATSRAFNGASWDDPTFFPFGDFYSVYSTDFATTLAMGVNLSVGITADTNVALMASNGLWGIVAGIGPDGATCTSGTIAGTVFTASGTAGTWVVGTVIRGAGVNPGSKIISFGTGTGGDGTYNLDRSSTVSVGESILGSGGPENAFGAYAVGIHVDENMPSAGIGTVLNTVQDNRMWDITGTWNNLVSGDSLASGTQTQVQWMSAGFWTSPNGTHRSIDIWSTDFYWFAGSTDIGIQDQGAEVFAIPMGSASSAATADQMARGCHYGSMVDAFRSSGNGSNTSFGKGSGAAGSSYLPSRCPIMSIVESLDGLVGGTSRAIVPPEFNWAVWSSIIHGTRGFYYFTNVDSGHGEGFSKTIQTGQSISMYNQALATNTLLSQLAPVINSAFALGYLTAVSPHGYLFPVYEANWLNGGIEACVHWYQGGNVTNQGLALVNGFYIFATTRDSETVTNISATFTVASGSLATVVGESRSIAISSGQFTDTFANAWTVHIYQIS